MSEEADQERLIWVEEIEVVVREVGVVGGVVSGGARVVTESVPEGVLTLPAASTA